MHQVRMTEVEPTVLAFICAYELGGLAGLWPTITARVRPLPWPLRIAVSTSAAVWVFLHFDCREVRRG